METLSLAVADGTKMQAYVCRPNPNPKEETSAAIIVLQEAFGVNKHIQEVVKRFADAGYLAIAPELYHRTAPAGFTCGYDQFQSLTDHFSAVTEQGLQQDARACYDWLSANRARSVAAIGYCMGGRAAFIANAAVPLKCAISYYGGRIAPNHLPLAGSQKSPLLFFWGGMDKHIPTEQIQAVNQALKAEGKKFTCVEISDADHGFFCDERPSYNPVASRQAWALTQEFLKDYLI